MAELVRPRVVEQPGTLGTVLKRLSTAHAVVEVDAGGLKVVKVAVLLEEVDLVLYGLALALFF